jgi:hypothetical protein
MIDGIARHIVARTITNNDRDGRSTRTLLASALALLVFACGGGGGGQLAGGGIGGTGSALGPVSAKGSLTVNGVRFDTDSAAIYLEGQRQPVLGDTSGIDEGMAVLIRGVYDSASAGRASEVVYLRNLLGPVSAISAVNSSFTALGQTVTIDNDPTLGTRMPGLANRLADLQPGDLVEVSGSADGSGVVAASFVRRVGTFTNGATEVEIKGQASNLDIAATTFVIGGLSVDYDANGGTQLRNLTLGDLGANAFVAVKGTTFDANGRLVATSIERIDRALSPGVNRRLEMQGIVADCTGICSNFSIDGQRVLLSASTAFRNGAANDLINDRKIEVEGTINGAGELLAQQISFVKGSVKIEALTDAPADTIAQTISVLGVSVKVNALTELKDGITLGSLGAGQALKILGYRTGAQQMIATRIERASGGGGKTRLEGPLQTASKGSATLTILSVPILAGQSTSFVDHSRSPTASISFDTFFDTTVTGAIVSARGAEGPDNQIAADEIQVEAQP